MDFDFPQALKKKGQRADFTWWGWGGWCGRLCCDIRQPSRMDGLERAELTENRHGDASWSPRRRRLSAQRRITGGGGSSGNWHLLTRSAPALSKFIVTVVVVVGSAVGQGALFSFSSTAENVSLYASGCLAEEHHKTRIVVKGPGLRDRIVWNKEIKGQGVGTRLSAEQLTM